MVAAEGFSSINWTGPNGFNGNGNSINGLSAGSYNANISNGLGCIEDFPLIFL